jgi:peptidoglycan/xylan/chitin deacetylase (PgdA/CDA1 family)
MTVRIACVTLDLEADYAGMTGGESYESLAHTEKFERLIRDSGARLTTFVTGFILDNDFPVLSRLKVLGSRFETHTYSHPLARPAAEKIADIRRGIEAYTRYFGTRPRGYRAPQGLISLEEVRALAGEGIAYSSSIFPSWLPGRYNNLRFPTQPFVYREAGLLEIPMAVIPRIRVPVTASHVNLLGWPLYRMLFASFGYPPLLNICTHLYDFADVDSYARLPLKEKIGYSRTRRIRDKTRGFAALLRHLASRGYRFEYLVDVAEELIGGGGAPRWSPRS